MKPYPCFECKVMDVKPPHKYRPAGLLALNSISIPQRSEFAYIRRQGTLALCLPKNSTVAPKKRGNSHLLSPILSWLGVWGEVGSVAPDGCRHNCVNINRQGSSSRLISFSNNIPVFGTPHVAATDVSSHFGKC